MTIKTKTLLKLLENCSDDLTVEQLTTFMRLSSHLRREILHAQKPAHPEGVAPESDSLPLHVTQFLAQSMDWTHLEVKARWDILRDVIWTNGMDLDTRPVQPSDPQDLISFEMYGHPLSLGLSVPHPLFKFWDLILILESL
jgi:hypothetical protein